MAGAGLTRRPTRGASGRRARELPETIANIFGWWRADSGITLNGATVSAWADKTAGKVLSQGTGAAQPTYVAADANFLNRPTFSYDDGDRLFSNLAASAWKFLHDGTGGTVVVCARADPADAVAGMCGTSWSSTGRVGVSAIATTAYRFVIMNGVTNVAPVDTMPAKGTTLWFAFGVTSTDIYRKASSLAYVSSSHSLTLSSGDPHSPFGVGNEGSDGNELNGQIAEVIIYQRAITSAEMATLGAYFVARYGATS